MSREKRFRQCRQLEDIGRGNSDWRRLEERTIDGWFPNSSTATATQTVLVFRFGVQFGASGFGNATK